MYLIIKHLRKTVAHHFRSLTVLNLQQNEKSEDVNVMHGEICDSSNKIVWYGDLQSHASPKFFSFARPHFRYKFQSNLDRCIQNQLWFFTWLNSFNYSISGEPKIWPFATWEDSPWAQTMSPVRIQIPISYRKPGPLNLWDHHLGSNCDGSMILKSVPSREINMDAPLGAFRKRFSQSSLKFSKK